MSDRNLTFYHLVADPEPGFHLECTQGLVSLPT